MWNLLISKHPIDFHDGDSQMWCMCFICAIIIYHYQRGASLSLVLYYKHISEQEV